MVFAALEPRFLHPLNLMNVLRQVSISGLVAIGMTFVILTAGIDLSVGSLVALCGLVAAYVAKGGLESRFAVGQAAEAGNPALVAMLAAIAVGMAAGAVQGLAITRLRVPPFVVTLGGLTAWRGAALLFSGGGPISGFPPEYTWWGQGRIEGVPVPVIIFLVAAVVAHVVLRYTRFGLHVYAVGGNGAGGRAQRRQCGAGGAAGLRHRRLHLRAGLVPLVGAAELGRGGGRHRARARRDRGGGDRRHVAVRRGRRRRRHAWSAHS